MDSKSTAPTFPNKMADLAFRAGIINLISWLPITIPDILHTFWSFIFIAAILLSTPIALAAGIWGLLKGRASARVVGRSFFGVIVGSINVILIVLSVIGIYGMVNAPF